MQIKLTDRIHQQKRLW